MVHANSPLMTLATFPAHPSQFWHALITLTQSYKNEEAHY